jgi:hypothetical protein
MLVQKLCRKISEVMSGQCRAGGQTMNDLGLLEADFMSGFSAGQMRQVISAFFPLPSREGIERNDSNLS